MQFKMAEREEEAEAVTGAKDAGDGDSDAMIQPGGLAQLLVSQGGLGLVGGS
jgi:hypothetical protein